MYKKMMRIMVNEMPTLVVADVASLGAIDAAQKFKIPLVLNSPTFPFIWCCSHSWLQVSSDFLFICRYGTMHEYLIRFCQLLWPQLLYTGTLRYSKSMDRYQSQHEIFAKDLGQHRNRIWSPRPIPPWVEMVGPSCPWWHLDAITLPDSLVEWLELQDVSGQKDP